MEKYIEFIKVHLPDIVSFVLIALAYIYQLTANSQGKKTRLITKTFFNEKTKLVDDAYIEVKATAENIKKEMAEIKAENKELKERLKSTEQAILAMCGKQDRS